MIKIIKASDRLKAATKVNMLIFGPSGVGKTTLARTLNPDTTLFVDLEAGTLAIQDWPGDVIDVRATAQEFGRFPWEIARALALYIGGHDPSDSAGNYSKPNYDAVLEAFKDIDLKKYDTIFVDSITVASRECFKWAEKQPEAVSEKTGKPDTRGAYGLMAREVIGLLKHLQHAPGKTTIMVGILERVTDEFGRVTWQPQMEGGKAARELPGIVDQVVSMGLFQREGDAWRHDPERGEDEQDDRDDDQEQRDAIAAERYGGH
jgi:hypothetical protein